MEKFKNFDIKVMGQRIKELRTSKNMFQDDLGEIINIGQSTIAAYENGRARPSFEVLIKLAQVFETTTDYLLGLVDFE